MKNKTSLLLTYINSLVLFLVIIFITLFFIQKNKPKTVYVDTIRFFSGFNMVSDIKSIHQKKLNSQRVIVDSLLFQLKQQTNKKIDSSSQANFILQNNKLREMSGQFATELTNQIWKRINQYSKEFGENNDYELILSTQGKGTIMYAKQIFDVTDKFIQFANTKYEGKQ